MSGLIGEGRYDEVPDEWERVWPSHDDITQMVERCIDDPDTLRYDIFYALSNNRWGYRDLEHAREMVGYVPKDSAEDYRK